MRKRRTRLLHPSRALPIRRLASPPRKAGRHRVQASSKTNRGCNPAMARPPRRASLVAPAAMLVAGLSCLVAKATAAPLVIDRAVVRFDAPETGGAFSPQFIFERELAFEARLEALADSDRAHGGVPYLDRHVRAALERHVAEELLSHLAMDPEPRADEIARRVESARAVLEQRIGGTPGPFPAAQPQGLG